MQWFCSYFDNTKIMYSVHASNVLDDNVSVWFRLTCLCVCDAVGSVTRRFPNGKPVWGVTSLDNRLYVLRGNKSSEQIEVYDVTSSYNLLQSLTVSGLGNGQDIVACRHNRCAYISDRAHDSVHRVDRRQRQMCIRDSGDSNNTRPLFWSPTKTNPFLSIAMWAGVSICALPEPCCPPNDLTMWPLEFIRHTRCNGSVGLQWHTMNCLFHNWIVCHGVMVSCGRVSTCSNWPSVLNSFILQTFQHDTSTPCLYVRDKQAGSSLTVHCTC